MMSTLFTPDNSKLGKISFGIAPIEVFTYTLPCGISLSRRSAADTPTWSKKEHQVRTPSCFDVLSTETCIQAVHRSRDADTINDVRDKGDEFTRHQFYFPILIIRFARAYIGLEPLSPAPYERCFKRKMWTFCFRKSLCSSISYRLRVIITCEAHRRRRAEDQQAVRRTSSIRRRQIL
jgi:hypothetical protein